jgi:hypothetical protein
MRETNSHKRPMSEAVRQVTNRYCYELLQEALARRSAAHSQRTRTASYAIISYNYWRRWPGGRPEAVDKTVTVRKAAHWEGHGLRSFAPDRQPALRRCSPGSVHAGVGDLTAVVGRAQRSVLAGAEGVGTDPLVGLRQE